MTTKPTNTASPQTVPDLPADLDTALRLVTRTLKSFDVAASSIQPKVFDYVSSLE